MLYIIAFSFFLLITSLAACINTGTSVPVHSHSVPIPGQLKVIMHKGRGYSIKYFLHVAGVKFFGPASKSQKYMHIMSLVVSRLNATGTVILNVCRP